MLNRLIITFLLLGFSGVAGAGPERAGFPRLVGERVDLSLRDHRRAIGVVLDQASDTVTLDGGRIIGVASIEAIDVLATERGNALKGFLVSGVIGAAIGAAVSRSAKGAVSQVVPASPLAGLWESDSKSNGGIGAALVFRPDGTYTSATEVLVDAFYRIIGDHLVIGDQPPAVDADTKAAGALSFRDNQCLLTGPDGSVITKERIGRAPEGVPPIVGVWRWENPGIGTVFERYTVDGHTSLRITLRAESGHFALSESAVALVPDRGPETRMTVDLKDNVLTLTNASSKSTGWHRIVEGAWYQIITK
ncbi:MAG: hypothetical protein WCQ64_17130 [Acidobacteriota bacterium]